MKKYVLDFCRRGLIACGFGPIVLAVLYLILHHSGIIDTLSVNQVCIGILSLSVLAFISGGINIVYQIEKLPLMFAILIQGCVLYASYLCTYLLNGWLELGTTPFLIFSLIFVVGYFAIWLFIFFTTKKRTKTLNATLKEKQLQVNGK